MPSRLAALLTVLSVVFTLTAIAVAYVGAFASIAFAAVGTLALAGWAWTRNAEEDVLKGLVAPYLLCIPLLIMLDTLRYLSGWVGMLESSYRPLFASNFAITDVSWFVTFVCAPASLMLLGGYFLSRRHPIGHFMAWWTALFAIADGLLQWSANWRGSGQISVFSVLGDLAAAALVASAVLVCQRLLANIAVPVGEPVPSTERRINLWTVLFVALVTVYGVTIFNQSGAVPLIIIVGSMLGGMVGWRKTTSRHPVDPAWAVPMFLLLLALFYIHVGEEALTDFAKAISGLTGTPWSEYQFMVLIALIGPVFWFFAAWSLWKRQAFGNFIFWFLIIGMILGEPAHVLTFPLLAMKKFGIGYEYFSGMYTALFPMVPAILSLVKIVGDHRRRQLTSAH